MESRAKEAYNIFAHRAGLDVAFEYLAVNTQDAWQEVVEFLEPEIPDFVIDCEDCGETLVCPVCQIDKFAVPAETAGKPTAVLVSKPPAA